MKANKWIIAGISAVVILGVLLVFALVGRENGLQPDPTKSFSPTEGTLEDENVTQAPPTDSTRQPTQGVEETQPPTETDDLDDMPPEIEMDPTQGQTPTDPKDDPDPAPSNGQTEPEDTQLPTEEETNPTENENTGTGTQPDEEEEPTDGTEDGDFSFDFGDLLG
jgi:hypothetical protein